MRNETVKKILEDYAEGAEKISSQLHAWEMNEHEARKLERQAREMWLEEAQEHGLSKKAALEMWQARIIDAILCEDPSFMDFYVI
jgi:hypothetical protein